MDKYHRSANRVKRGGNWNNSAINCTTANRNNNNPANRNNNIGLRLAASSQLNCTDGCLMLNRSLSCSIADRQIHSFFWAAESKRLKSAAFFYFSNIIYYEYSLLINLFQIQFSTNKTLANEQSAVTLVSDATYSKHRVCDRSEHEPARRSKAKSTTRLQGGTLPNNK